MIGVQPVPLPRGQHLGGDEPGVDRHPGQGFEVEVFAIVAQRPGLFHDDQVFDPDAEGALAVIAGFV